MTDPTLSDLVAISRDTRESKMCELLQITGPGAYVIREPDGRLMVWASEADSIDDDGQRATYRSTGPITDAEWETVIRMAWVDDYESI